MFRFTLRLVVLLPLIFASLMNLQVRSKGVRPTSEQQSGKQARPNILVAIADDASYPHMSAYGTSWIATPNFDRVARNGLLFNRAYTPNAKCAPSRAALLTGRNSWQLGAAANHWPYWPDKFTSYVEALKKQGYYTGHTGKGWAPGVAEKENGGKRYLTGAPFAEHEVEPPASGMSDNDYATNFKAFLEQKGEDQPFVFWYGAREPHRAYEYGSGMTKGGKHLNNIQVPSFWPDNDTVRTDMLDYAFEIEHFDRHLGRMLDLLKKRGELENTLVVVTSDNGMPFPRIKGQEYEMSNHMPLALMWKAGITNPGRVIEDVVSFIDFAPTFLEVAGFSEEDSGMQPITGKSLTNIFYSEKAGQVDPMRDRVLIGKERHDIGRPHDWGYPIRGIITSDYLYLHNFKTNRWPAGPPETGYRNTDGSPTKTVVLESRKKSETLIYWRQSFGKRPSEELYRLPSDPENVDNLASDTTYQDLKDNLKERLFAELKKEGDPRMFGQGDIFEAYPYGNSRVRNFYKKYMNGDLDKTSVGRNPSDFEPNVPDSLRSSPSNPPNIVVFFVDDLGWADIAYSQQYETPNIDQLMAESATFTNAYSASPTCSPSRASLLTGRHPARLGITRHIPSASDSLGRLTEEFNYESRDPAQVPSRNWLPLQETTFAEALDSRGYQAAFIGKWHLGHEPYYPIHQGFDYQRGVSNFGHPFSYTAPYWRQRSHTYQQVPKGTYLTNQVTKDAIGYLENAGQPPFLLTLFYYGVHGPFEGPSQLVKKFKQKGLSETDARRAAMFATVDKSVGRIRSVLEKRGYADNTVIIFAGDQGGPLNKELTNKPLRGGKPAGTALYEGGARIPFIIHWPGVTAPGSRYSKPVTTNDVFPTIVQMAGGKVSAYEPLDGISLLPLLKGGKINRDAIVMYRSYDDQYAAVRSGQWKLIHYRSGKSELFNLEKDLSETDNVADEHPDIIRQLEEKLANFEVRMKLK